MVEANNLRFTCIRCGKCCTDKDTLVSLTYLDILRIKKGLKLSLEETIDILGFYTFNKIISLEEEKRMAISPIETEQGLAFIGLLKNKVGKCYFYDSDNKKCLIYNLRPVFCQTFPFSFGFLKEKSKENNTIDIFFTEKGKEYCPGISKDSPVIDRNYWLELGDRVLEEIKKNHFLIEKWNNSVKEKKITPTVKKFILSIFKLEDS